MKATDPAMRVYRFRIVGDLPPEAIEELHRAHVLSNQLVEIYERHQERISEVWAQFPELAVAEQRREVLEEELVELVAQSKKARMKERSTAIPADLRQRVKDKRAELRETKAVLRGLKERIYPSAKPLLAQAATDRRAKIKALYRPSVDGGLYWANFNETVARHDAAVKGVASRRKAGLPANIRFHRWTQTGTLMVQLQREAGKPPRDPTLIASSSSPWANVARLVPAHDPVQWEAMSGSARQQAKKGTLRFRIGSGDRAAMVEVPVKVHRPIPLDADITMMRITRQRIASHYRCHVSIIVRLPQVPRRTEGPLVAVHTGWRTLSDGAMRVAVLSGVGPPPRSLDAVVRAHDGWYEIVIPNRWSDLQEQIEKRRSLRDHNIDLLQHDLVAWLKEHPQDDERLNAATVGKWSSPRRFAALAMRWRTDYPEDGKEIAARLWDWRRQDRHLWEWEANERDSLLTARDEAWKIVAAWVTAEAAVVRIDGWDIQPLARVPSPEDVDGWQDRAARANRVLASPGKLRATLEGAASARGVEIVRVTTAISQTHFGCGGILDAADRAAKVMVPCETCGSYVDQDVNALDHLRAASPPVTP